MARYWLASLIAAALAAVAVPSFAATAPAGGAHATNLTQQRENKSNPDRWKRGESQSSDDEDDDDSSKRHKKDHDEDAPKGAQHRGELNGKLELGSW